MSAAQRKTPTVANGGPRDGTSYMAAVDVEDEALWKCVTTELVSVGGTANAITASSDTSLVVAIAAYARPMGFYLTPTASNTGAVTINIDSVGAVAVKDQFGAALQGGELSSGGRYHLSFDGIYFRADGIAAGAANRPTTKPDVLLQEQQPSGTSGGTFTAGAYRTRLLNTLVVNNIGASLASNQVTLPAGTYYAEWRAPARSAGSTQTRLFNATDSTVLGYGSSAYGLGANAQADSLGQCVFTITTSKAIELDHRCSSTEATDGFGLACGFGNIEIYAELRLWKQ